MIPGDIKHYILSQIPIEYIVTLTSFNTNLAAISVALDLLYRV
jgi:hypothetical protein